VEGKAWMLTGGTDTVITLVGDKPKGARFVLYFSATAAE
jgi:hypothetical protein